MAPICVASAGQMRLAAPFVHVQYPLGRARGLTVFTHCLCARVRWACALARVPDGATASVIDVLPQAGFKRHVRNAAIGLCCSLVSDTCTNSIRVVKTVKQTSPTPISYLEAAETVIATDGISGLLMRGLVRIPMFCRHFWPAHGSELSCAVISDCFQCCLPSIFSVTCDYNLLLRCSVKNRSVQIFVE
jgi:hypothetical protein